MEWRHHTLCGIDRHTLDYEHVRYTVTPHVEFYGRSGGWVLFRDSRRLTIVKGYSGKTFFGPANTRSEKTDPLIFSSVREAQAAASRDIAYGAGIQ